MLEKLLLAATITLSLSAFLNLSSQPVTQQTLNTPSANAIRLAQNLNDGFWLGNLFQ